MMNPMFIALASWVS